MRCLLVASISLLAGGLPGQYALDFSRGGQVGVAKPRIAVDAQLGVELWFKTLDSIRKPVHVVSRWAVDGKAVDGVFYIGFSNSTRATFAVRSQAGEVQTCGGRFKRRDGVWRHLLASFDGAKLTLVIDGRKIAEQDVEGFGKLAASKLPLVLGPVAVSRSRRTAVFPGFLADVTLWSVPRTSERVAKAGRARPSLNADHLLAHYRLFEPVPTDRVEDSAGNGSAGKLTAGLARSGWCYTRMWTEDEAESLDLHCFDERLAMSPQNTIVSHEKTGQVGVLWQDEQANAIQLTWVAADLGGDTTVKLEGPRDGILAAGTTDPKGNVYYFVIRDKPFNRAEGDTLEATLYKASPDGKPLLSQPHDMSREAFNTWKFDRRRRGNMRFSKGTLGLILPRTMYISGDGLRHQSAIAVTFSAKTLEVSRMLGTTSSHSMGNIMTLDSKGEFIGLDLGDNYPRGVHLHKFTASHKSSAVVYTFKTEHGRRPRNGSPVYKEISGDGQTFYKWSNDNSTYSELGGVTEDRRGFFVIFSTDRSLAGKVLDNSRAFPGNGDPRDLAMVHVIKRFQKAARGSVVSDALMVKLPKDNVVETGGFFGFNGGWSKQRITGVTWLTHYKAHESARSPQVIQTLDGGTLVLWRKTGPDGASLRALRIDKKGNVSEQPLRMNIDLTPNREDRLLRLDDRIWLLAADGGGTVRLYFVTDAK